MKQITYLAIAAFAAIALIALTRCCDERPNLTQAQIDSLLIDSKTQRRDDTPKSNTRSERPLDDGVEYAKVEVFPFDPNTADTTALLRLGLPRWMIRGMLKYRAKGGRYQSAQDVQRIPGMTPEIFQRIEPYIRIDERFKPYDRKALDNSRKAADNNWSSDSLQRPAKLPQGAKLNINTADSAQLCQVPGIGPYRARLIIRRREALGGFVSVSQLSELPELPDSCARWFMTEQSEIRRININTSSLSSMSRHPYIGRARAVAIDNYRRIKGAIKSLDDLSVHPDFSTEDIDRLQPYITF